MRTIDSLIKQVKDFFALEGAIRFNTPEYVKFHNQLTNYIYKNHFEDTPEWKRISDNLVYKSTQRMVEPEANIILTQLDALKRRELERNYAIDWKLIHPEIVRVSRPKFRDEHYFESARCAFIEINARVKKIFPELRDDKGRQYDGCALMQQVFSEKHPKIVLGDLNTDTGRNTQIGYMNMFAGSVSALRNPKAHENDELTVEDTVRQLMFASMLMYKLDEALKTANIEEGKGNA